MSFNAVLFDLDSAKERLDLYNRIFPREAIARLFEFRAELSTGENLNNLALEALLGGPTAGYLFVYRPIFLEVISRWTTELSHDDERKIRVLEAAARIITLYPVASTLVEEFLDRQNANFKILLQQSLSSGYDDETAVTRSISILLAYYRLLYHNKEKFLKYIDPKILYGLIKQMQSFNTPVSSVTNLANICSFLSIKILSICLDFSESVTDDMVKSRIPSEELLFGPYEMDSHVNYKFLELNEAKRFSNFSRLPQVNDEICQSINDLRDKHNFFSIEPSSLTNHIVSICGVLVPSIHSTKHDRERYQTTFVPTKRTIASFRKLAEHVQAGLPIMLVGPAGSGKTFLVDELSKYMGYHDSIVRIHLGEQTDAKLLIGTYKSGEKPGTFEWTSGVLTTAVKEGRCVLIEDIDKAPTEVLSILLSLLERRKLTIPSRGETISAANGFQLISTVRIDESRLHKGKKEKASEGEDETYGINMIGRRIWNTLHLEDMNDEELKQILCARYPVLSQLVPKLIETYLAVKELYSDSRFISLNKGAHLRILSSRDLIKLCQRLQLLFQYNNITKPDQLIEASVYDNIFAETADCFASSVSERKALEPLIRTIGSSLDITSSRVSLFIQNHIPQLEILGDHIRVGRATLTRSKSAIKGKSVNSTSFATTDHALRLIEQIAVAVEGTEPVLLVGETGTGKTTVVQQLAKMVNKHLTVINVSQQTESGDLLGGYKPVNLKTIAIRVQETFEPLFAATFSLKKNEKFYTMLHKCFNKSQWKNVARLWEEACKMSRTILKDSEPAAVGNSDDQMSSRKKKKRKLDPAERRDLVERWSRFGKTVEEFKSRSAVIENSFVFDFVEGSLVKAVRNGEWLLLDEINLASADTLESISDLLSEKSSRSILLSEKGDVEPVHAHPEFRIFACMNPATDVGKRDLPSSIRSRFTEIYVHSPDSNLTDLLAIIDKYIEKYSVSDEWVGNDIASLYMEAKELAESNKIVDGSNQKPHFSIRTLTRTLLYVRDIAHIYGLRRSLYEGFCMSFLTLLDQRSSAILEPIIEKYTIARLKNAKSILSKNPPSPGADYVQFNHYWLAKGPEEIVEDSHYIITPFVERNLMNLVRATSSKRFPILIQGPTSAGKTSMIKYLADITGHKFVRINNHEHTDLQEYVGTYIADDTGKLIFREGVLVEALRKGYWIVLDELNLAPTDILEALNRLLDDNRELLIPETQELVHPHPNFMLFATQNPPGLYGGRKTLSRAFRNRFLELHYDDIPQDELEIILRERCQIAPSYAKKIVEVYRQLSVERSASRLFEQKNSFATLRDLFRWAQRDAVGYEQLAANGYMLLAEKCRNPQEKVVIKRVLERVMRVKLDMESYYMSLEDSGIKTLSSVVWTRALRRLVVLVSACLKNNEPVLLVGETGCGKTTVCQLLAEYLHKELIILNAHQNTETGDILGAQRPMRNRSRVKEELVKELQTVLGKDDESDLDVLISLYKKVDCREIDHATASKIKELEKNMNTLFEWCDGPLVHALKKGQFFLLDEISLADDSVLERLNSVLEPERSLLLAEKGTSDSTVTAKDGFQFFATMNPGGDYGKKELSPALRNRFTEIWFPSMESFDDVRLIVSDRLHPELRDLTNVISDFSEWFGMRFGGGDVTNGIISLRDILAWVDFINRTYSKTQDPYISVLHGAAMVFIDGLGTNNTSYLAEDEDALERIKLSCVEKLSEIMGHNLLPIYQESHELSVSDGSFVIGHFGIPIFKQNSRTPLFNLRAPTTATNLMRIVRALQVPKPVLLEGSPGVGKTSLVAALAEMTGNTLVRINLSEQTDLVDLFGSDAPGEEGGEFVWSDAAFLSAMQKGHWVLLDEMNLASQSVLEGLNACLDHRGEAYIPELDRTFSRHPNFLVFAAQNPQYQGGGRKGLPKSFINRFTVVYMEMLKTNDLSTISSHLYPQISEDVILKIISLMSALEDEVSKKKKWGSSGAPWEFNLRDTLRWLSLLTGQSISSSCDALNFVGTIVEQRFRTLQDRLRVQKLIKSIFGELPKRENFYNFSKDFVQMNSEVIPRNQSLHYSTTNNPVVLECNIPIYESILRCLKNNWPIILVGPSNSGKTDIIQSLGSLLGKKVDVFSMNSDIDSTDILGGYEQVDFTRKMSHILNNLKDVLKCLVASRVVKMDSDQVTQLALGLLNYISEKTVTISNFSDLSEGLNLLLSHIPDNQQLLGVVSRMEALLEEMKKQKSIKFEWCDGLLVRAVEEGHWLVLDNANLCSPSVLDRLNSLLEVGGSLLINECSQPNGQPRILKPHPNFRLFLTVNPAFGELSRAMRNRGIELFVDALKERSTTFDSYVLKYSERCVGYESKDIVEDLSHLTLQDALPVTPLWKFMPNFLSSLAPFSRVHDIILISENSVPSAEALACLIPISLLPMSHVWQRNIENNRSFTEGNISSEVVRYIEFISQSRLLDTLCEIANTSDKLILGVLGTEARSKGYQSFLPLLNIYTLSDLRANFPYVDSSESLFLLICMRILMYTQLMLERANSRSLHVKLDELNYIEKAAALSNGRNVKPVPRIPIYTLLRNLCQALMGYIEDAAQFRHSDFGKRLFGMLVIIAASWDNAHQSNEARMRIFYEACCEWVKSSQEVGFNVPRIATVLTNFSYELSFQRGQSIDLLWENFRKVYPPSMSGWQLLEEFQRLCSAFDSTKVLQFSEAYESIGSLTISIQLLFTEIMKGGGDYAREIIEKLETGILQLRNISDKFLIERKHFLMEDFDNLVVFLINSQATDINLLLSLAPFSSIPTRKLVRFASDNYPYPPIFDLMWRIHDGKFETTMPLIISSAFFENIIQKITSFESFPGSQIDQALSDVASLLSSTIRSSPYLLKDHVHEYKTLLANWIKKIVQLHAGNGCTMGKEGDLLLEYVQNHSKSYFAEVYRDYLHPALIMCDRNASTEQLGRAWILFGVGLLNLYVPDRPYDPAIRDYVHYDIYLKHRAFSEELVEGWSKIREVVSGDEAITVEEALYAISDIPAPKKPKVYRPEKSVDSLFEEWTFFLSSTISKDHLFNLMEVMREWGEVADSRYALFQQASSNFLTHLESGYQQFMDLNEIFGGYIFSLKFGFDLLKYSAVEETKTSSVSTLWPIDIGKIVELSETENLLYSLGDIIKGYTMEDTDAERLLLYFLHLCALHKNDRRSQSLLDKVLQLLYYRWSLRQVKDAREDQMKTSLYKYEGTEDDVETEIKKLFPDYEELLTYDKDEQSLPEDALEELYYEQAQIYISMFSPDKENESVQHLLKLGTEVVNLMVKQSERFKSHNLSATHLTGLLNILYEKTKLFDHIPENQTPNFYKSHSVHEMKKAITIVTDLLAAVSQLYTQWPENAILKELAELCTGFLGSSLNVPVAKLLVKIENIYRYVVEWENYAATKVSLGDHMKHITGLIISWRRLELQTWGALFDMEDNNLRKSIGKWWFYLFETIIVAHTDKGQPKSSTELLTALNVFFSGGTLGEFAIRLQLVRAFKRHVDMIGPSVQALSHSLDNILTFYNQFLPVVTEQLQKGRKTLEKEMAEVILLASWKDVNIDAMRQSSRKSHNSLFKLVRKYRALISTPVSPIIEAGLPYLPRMMATSFKMNQSSVISLHEENIQEVVKNIPGWETRSNTLKNVDGVCKNMSVFIGNISSQAFPMLTETVRGYAQEANRLRDETPKVYKKEIKKQLANLKAQKNKLFSDALKELRRAGLKVGLREDIHKVQYSATGILANSVSFSGTPLEDCDTYYFRIIDLIPRLRNCVANPAEDIPVAGIERGMAMIENLIFSLITQRGPLQELAMNFKEVQALTDVLEKYCSSEGFIHDFSLHINLARARKLSKDLPKLIDYVISTLEIIDNSVSTKTDTLFLLEAKKRLLSFDSYLVRLAVSDSKTEQETSNFETFLNEFVVQLRENRSKLNFFVFDTLLDWITRNSTLEGTPLEEPPLSERILTLQEVDSALRRVYTSVVISFQKVMEDGYESLDQEQDQWLSISSKTIFRHVRALRSGVVTSSISDVVHLLRGVDFNSNDAEMVRAMIKFTLPVIRNYSLLLGVVMSKACAHYVDLSQSTYILSNILYNLASKGFCSPEPPSEEVDDKYLHEGTGLGDGEGVENASKDVEQDEDLTENAQTSNEDQKSRDEEDEDDQDAVEMEGDMAGQLEDLSEQENNEEDMENQSEDQEELDEEIDNIDDDDPNAIDEKMWDKPPDEDVKEKTSDKSINNAADDGDVQAGEDQKDESGDSGDNDTHETQEGDKMEEDEPSEGEGEEDVGLQEDEVKNEETQELDSNIQESEALELPDDMNLDQESGDDADAGGEGDMLDQDTVSSDGDEDENFEVDEGPEHEKDNTTEEEKEDAIDMASEDEATEGQEEADIEVEEAEENPEADREEGPDSDVDELAKQEFSDGEGKQMDASETVEGLEGVEDDRQAENDADSGAATQQMSGSKASGADAKDVMEQEDIGESGNAQDVQMDDGKTHDESSDVSRLEAKEALRQLGDSLKEFHRRRQEIREASERANEDKEDIPKANQRPDEFEHVNGANTENDMQALGSATQEQLQHIDEDMAIDDGDDENDIEADNTQEEEGVPKQGDEDNSADVGAIDEEDMVEQNMGEEEEDEQNDSNKATSGVFAGAKSNILEELESPNSDNIIKVEAANNDLDDLIEEVDREVKLEPVNDVPKRRLEESRALWRKSELATSELVSRLSEQLRLILEPTMATKLKGDYKTGKRLNMKRIIPYIASQYRKDKIWLRRTKPSKRQYQIIVALDNSKSMSESNCVKLAFDSLCLVSKTLTQLESGDLGIVKFGETIKEVHPLNQQFSNDSGAKVFQWFDFQDTGTNVKNLIAESIKIFENSSVSHNSDQWRLEIVISDGICEDHETIERLVRRAREMKIMVVFVIIDGINSSESILDMNQVNYVPDQNGIPKLEIKKYLDSFPFEFYVIVHNINELPEMLSLILRQYFSDLSTL